MHRASVHVRHGRGITSGTVRKKQGSDCITRNAVSRTRGTFRRELAGIRGRRAPGREWRTAVNKTITVRRLDIGRRSPYRTTVMQPTSPHSAAPAPVLTNATASSVAVLGVVYASVLYLGLAYFYGYAYGHAGGM